MKLKRRAVAGTLESSDIMITLEPLDTVDEKPAINLTSVVEQEFGEEIRAAITQTLKELGVCGGSVEAVDHGALDCTIRARVKTAAMRAAQPDGATEEGIASGTT